MTINEGDDVRRAEGGKDGFGAWLMLALLSCAYILSMVDRTVLSLMVEPIKADFGLNDTQIALLQGASFAVLYGIAAVPIAWLADRSNRKVLISIGIACWSAMTAVCGFANSYALLFGARAGVAIGEATLTPATYSLLSDSFSKQRLGRAIGIFTAAGVVGTGIALLAGGKVLSTFSQMGTIDLGLLGMFQPWQATFLLFALPGFILALVLMLVVREPVRIRREAKENGPGSVYALLRTRPLGYGGLIAGYTALCALGYAFLNWAPTSLIRIYQSTPSEVGLRIGMIMLIFGTLGPVGAGFLSDRLSRRQGSDGALRVLIFASIMAAFFSIAAALSNGMNILLFSYCGIALTFTACLTIVPLTLQLITPPEFRARIAGLALAVGNVIGLTSGPLLVGLLNDHVFVTRSGIATSLPTVLLGSSAMMLIFFSLAYRTFTSIVREV